MQFLLLCNHKAPGCQMQHRCCRMQHMGPTAPPPVSSALPVAGGQPSLGRKITLGYYAIAMLIIGAAALTFFEFSSLEAKVSLGERTAELLDTTLEIRRFERNYFLHRQAADYDETRRQVARARALLDDNRAGFAAVAGPAALARF